MCSGKRKPPTMDISVLLELAASDDLAAFKTAVEERGLDVVNEPSPWYGRRIGSSKMSFEERTPIMIAAMFGSKSVLSYILQTGCALVNAASASDSATALHCAAAGASSATADVVELLLAADADADSLDAGGNRPVDLIGLNLQRKKSVEAMLNGYSGESPTKREYSVDLSLPDIKNEMYTTDEFRMYSFKIKPCSRAYSHDWTECPFVHPGENARRRDPRKFHYSCVPCPEFRKGACRQGDTCDYAHGIFECWLHPAQYRTRLCKDETGCQRRVCFFAHKPHELRPLYASTGSAVPSPHSFFEGLPSSPIGLFQSPPPLQLPGSRLFGGGVDSYRLASSPSGWNNGSASAANFDDVFGQSPTGVQLRQSYPINLSSASASGGLSSRAVAFAKRSQSFIERSAVNRHSGFSTSPMAIPSLVDWGSADGKLDWGIQQGDDLNKFRKSASFGLRSSNGIGNYAAASVPEVDEPDVSWVQSLVVDPQPVKPTSLFNNSFQEQQLQSHFDAGPPPEMIPAWLEQMYMEQEQMVV